MNLRGACGARGLGVRGTAVSWPRRGRNTVGKYVSTEFCNAAWAATSFGDAVVFKSSEFLVQASPYFYFIVSQVFKLKFSKKIAIFICINVEQGFLVF